MFGSWSKGVVQYAQGEVPQELEVAPFKMIIREVRTDSFAVVEVSGEIERGTVTLLDKVNIYTPTLGTVHADEEVGGIVCDRRAVTSASAGQWVTLLIPSWRKGKYTQGAVVYR